MTASPPPSPSVPPIDVLDSTAAGPAAIRGGALRGAGYGLSLALSVASVPLVVRHLGIEDFGRLVLVVALITLVGGLTEVGLQAVGVREYSVRSESERELLMRNLLGVRIALTTVGVLGAVLFTVLAGYDRTLVLGTALSGVALLAQSVQTLLAVPLIAQLRLGWATVAELLRQSVTVGLTIALVVAGAGLLSFFAIAIPGALAAVALTAYLVRGLLSFRPSFDPAAWWSLLRETIAYAVAIAVNVTYFRIAIVIMSFLATDLEVGYFAASFRVLEVLLPIPALVVGAVFPILVRAARDDLNRLAYASQRIFEVAVIGGAGLMLMLEVAAPLIVRVLADEAGDPAIEVLRIQAPSVLATFLAVAAGYCLLSLRLHREMLWANLAALVLSVSLTFALVPSLGAQGAAVATTAAEWALAIVTTGLLIRAMGALRLSMAVLGPVALATAAGACALLLPVPAIAQAIVAPVLYIGILGLLGAIPTEVGEALLARRRPGESA